MYNRHSRELLRKAIRIETDWESFLNEHPEITVLKSDTGKIINVFFPKGSTNTTLLLFDGKVICLEYCLGNHYITFSISDIINIDFGM